METELRDLIRPNEQALDQHDIQCPACGQWVSTDWCEQDQPGAWGHVLGCPYVIGIARAELELVKPQWDLWFIETLLDEMSQRWDEAARASEHDAM